MELHDVLKKPLVTEKAEFLRASNVYVFEVAPKANKKLIKQAVKEIFGVVPAKVNIVNSYPKIKRARFGWGYTSQRKKAYIHLNKKDTIELFEGA